MMSEVKKNDEVNSLSALEKSIFDAISQSDIGRLRQCLGELKSYVDFYDESGMTPLQSAAFRGSKDAVQLLLDHGANVNSSRHQYGYTALHFAALSANAEVCLQLLIAGACATATNSVNRTPAQMAAFVGNRSVVQAINNFIPKSEIEYFTTHQDKQQEPHLPPVLTEPFHRFVMLTNLHPVKIALMLQKTETILNHLDQVRKTLSLMVEKEMKRRNDVNEIMAFKFHYLGWIVSEIIKCRDHFLSRKEKSDDGKESKSDFIELFAKKVLKQPKEGQMDYSELTIRDCVREFPWRDCTVFRQIVTQLVNKDNALPAFEILKTAIFGHNAFAETIVYCQACGEENPTKKCSKCKEASYCSRECQRLHWGVHKKVCARSPPNGQSGSRTPEEKPIIDTAELHAELQKMGIS